MNSDKQRLQLIIETALKHGADISPFNKANGDNWDIKEMGLALYNRDGEMYLFIPVSTLLYGNNLSLLKAACADLPTCSGCGYMNYEPSEDFEPATSCGSYAMTIPFFHWVAQQSVLLPDSERLAFIVEHLRED